jgi:RNA polymerase sigma-70 factor (ECF subfamily)
MLQESGKKSRLPRVVQNGYDVNQDTTADFRALFEKHKDRVYSIARRYSGDPAAAMDIAQDTFLKLMGRMDQYRGDSSFEAWLYRIVVNACLDHRRSNRRLQPLLDGFLDLFRTPDESALDDLLKDEMRQQVQDVVAKLAPEQRMVVILRYTEGLQYEEIAEVLGCSKGTVASRLNRAHKILERRLQGVRDRAYA